MESEGRWKEELIRVVDRAEIDGRERSWKVKAEKSDDEKWAVDLQIRSTVEGALKPGLVETFRESQKTQSFENNIRF